MEDLRTSFVSVPTMGDLFLAAMHRQPDAEALVFPDGRRNYAELAQNSMERARAFLALGVRRGDHVAILLPSCIEFVEVFFGLQFIGAVPVPVNARYRAHELRYVIANADAVALVTTGRVADAVNFVERLGEAFPTLGETPVNAAVALAEAPCLKNLVLAGSGEAPGFHTLESFLEKGRAIPETAVHAERLRVRLRDIALLLYTSGTTSSPKGCLITHEALVRNAQAMSSRYEVTSADRFWSPLPMFHIASVLTLASILDRGGAYLSQPHFEAGAAIAMLIGERATMSYASFAAFILDMVHHPDFAAQDWSAMRLSNSNLVLMPPELREKLAAAWPNCAHVASFGMTETCGPMATSGPHDPREQRHTRLGRPMPGVDIRILREDGSAAAPGETGEICTRGYHLFEGYYKDPEKTAQALRDGWYHSGDLGALDADGTLIFQGRLKDMLKVGGENVAALEIESHVMGLDGVKQCQIVGRPDPRLTEVPVAFVELREGHRLTAEDVITHCRGRIAAFKVPREVRFVTEWPTSASKIQKFKLAEMLRAEAAAQ